MLASYANLSLYSAMVVLTLSMLGYAGYLAGLLPARDARVESAEAPDRELVAAGGGGGDAVPTGARAAGASAILVLPIEKMML